MKSENEEIEENNTTNPISKYKCTILVLYLYSFIYGIQSLSIVLVCNSVPSWKVLLGANLYSLCWYFYEYKCTVLVGISMCTNVQSWLVFLGVHNMFQGPQICDSEGLWHWIPLSTCHMGNFAEKISSIGGRENHAPLSQSYAALRQTKLNSSGCKKYETRVVGNISSYCSNFFLFWWILKIRKTSIFTNFTNNVKKCMLFGPIPPSFCRFNKVYKVTSN